MTTLARLFSATAFIVLAALPSAARADITITENEKSIDVDCAKDGQIRLQGNHLTVTIKGVCKTVAVEGNNTTVTGSATSVRIAGNHNTVTLAAADDVSIDGNRNTVTVGKALKLKAPRIANTGTDNKVTQPK
jgi:hypothetical protein